MSLSTPLRPVSAPARGTHEHTRSCWWDHLACRWAGPAHPAAASPVVPVPAPRVSLEG
jgi:hypothetical protein